MMIQYDEIALCAHVQRGKVRYFKEYTLRGRVVGTEYIPYPEFVRLLTQREANKQSVKDACEYIGKLPRRL
jgi:hypothetical protein